MSGDQELIRRVLGYADRNTRVLHQGGGCRTFDGTFCIPTIAVNLSGGRWAGEPGGDLSEWVVAEPGDDPDDIIHLVHCHTRAKRLLKVDLALDDDLTVADLRKCAER